MAKKVIRFKQSLEPKKIKDNQNVESPPVSKPLTVAEMCRLCPKLHFGTQLNRRITISITDRWIQTFRDGQHCKAIFKGE